MQQDVSPISENVHMSTRTQAAKVKKNLGAVYTPEFLALWLAQRVKQFGFRPEVVLDPAAGGGALIRAALEVFPGARGWGFEIDRKAHLALKAHWLEKNSKPGNSLTAESWIPEKKSSVLIFSNPPWGAYISKEEDTYYRNSFTSARGMYDTYDLFLEKSIEQLPQNSWGAFFVPDSILLKQHQNIRKILLQNTQIKSITRLPEGTFSGVAMGVIAIIFKKAKPKSNSKILISRIDRSAFLSLGENSQNLKKALCKREHFIGQSLWSSDPNFSWTMEFKKDADFLEGRSVIDGSIEPGSNWDRWFESGRGLEIGKKSKYLTELHGKKGKLVGRKVAVGEDVNRLQVEPSKYLVSKISGLDLKSELDDNERLLIRKTGIGIKAVVATGVSTTQTIYHFLPKKSAPPYAMHYAAGFLISRVVIALHLAKTGETEWRSHPYITQRAIRELNLPIPKKGSVEEKIAKEIASISKSLHKKGRDTALEIRLDQLVCQIIGGTSDLLNWSYNFLADVKGCSYTRELVKDISLELRVA